MGKRNNRSIAGNMFFNCLKAFLNTIYPLLTFSYASRIIGVQGIGKVNFAKSVITYFQFLSLLGLPVYGVTQIARYRDDKKKLSKTFQELFFLNGVMTLLSYLLLGICLKLVPGYRAYREVIWISSISVFFSALGCEYFFTGLEEYKYIAIRSVFMQIFSLLCLFLFVKEEKDYLIYAALNGVSAAGAGIVNFICLKEKVEWKKYKNYKLFRHLKEMLVLSIPELAIMVYGNTDVLMINYFINDYEVGLYSTALKIDNIMIGIVNAGVLVLLPRATYYVTNHQVGEFNRLIKKVWGVTELLVYPMSAGIFLLAGDILHVLAGERYSAAAVMLGIMAWKILFVSLNVLMVKGILVPMERVRVYVASTLFSAFANVAVNALLIPWIGGIGAAIATDLAEFSCFIFLFVHIENKRRFITSGKERSKIIVSTIGMWGICTRLKIWLPGSVSAICIIPFAGVVLYFSFLILLKSEVLCSFVLPIMKKEKKGKRYK